MKRILIVGASPYQLPGIVKAIEMGLFVGVVDQNPNAPGVRYANVFYEVSTTDEVGVWEAAKDFQADAVFTLATDQPMRAVAYATEQLGLPGLPRDVAVTATDKYLMREALRAKAVPIPWFIRIKDGQHLDPASVLSFPCISKPVDSSGSRGVMYLDDPKHLDASIAYSASFSKHREVIVEEFMEGPEVSCEMLVVDGQPVVLQVTDKITSGKPHFVEIAHSQPSLLPKEALSAIETLASDACLALGLDNCAAHVEIMLTFEGPKIVELGARMGGDLIGSQLVQLSTGVDMTRAAIELALGQRPMVERHVAPASATVFLLAKSGIITEIYGIESAKELPGIEDVYFFFGVGDRVHSLKTGSDRIAQVVAVADTPEEALARCEKALSMIEITVSDKTEDEGE